MLLKELSELMTNQVIPSNPIVNGFIFEERFFKEVEKSKVLHVSTMERSLKFNIIQVKNLKQGEMVNEMMSGCLYHLRYRHPVIDGIGVFETEGTSKRWLVFIQISLSTYANHGTKISDLFRFVKCPELKTPETTIFEYYKGMNPKVKQKRCVYVYASPKEINSFTDHTHINFALVIEGSVTYEQLEKLVAYLPT